MGILKPNLPICVFIVTSTLASIVGRKGAENQRGLACAASPRTSPGDSSLRTAILFRLTRCLHAQVSVNEVETYSRPPLWCESEGVLIDMMWATWSRSPTLPSQKPGFGFLNIPLPASHRRCQETLGVITGPLGSNRLLDVAAELGSNFPGPGTDPVAW